MNIVMDVNTNEIGILNIGISLFIGHMASRIFVSKPFAVTEIHDVNKRALMSQTNDKILKSYVSVYVSEFMDLFKAIQNLQSY